MKVSRLELSLQLPQYLCQFRHKYHSFKKPVESEPIWKLKDKLRTSQLVLALCLNIGTDPPDVIKTDSYSRDECWINPFSFNSKEKALDRISKQLSLQYGLHTKAKIKSLKDTNGKQLKDALVSARASAQKDIVLFHYNGHGVPMPTTSGEIWLFNEKFTQYVPVSINDVRQWMGAPSVFVFDCSGAGTLFPYFKDVATSGPQETIVFGACGANEVLPNHPSLPADIFTACLTTPVKIALRCFVANNPLSVVQISIKKLEEQICGSPGKRQTPFGQLNWLLTTITDSIAWQVLPHDIFQKYFRQDPMISSLFRNFLLANKILRSMGATPQSIPALPPTDQHPLWETWDLAIEKCLSQLSNEEGSFQDTTFFSEQMKAFDVWVSHQNRLSPPKRPNQLAIILQAFLSNKERTRALDLLGKFLDLHPEAIKEAMCVGIFPYLLKLVASPAPQIHSILLFVSTKFFTVNKQAPRQFLGNKQYIFFMKHLRRAVDERKTCLDVYVKHKEQNSSLETHHQRHCSHLCGVSHEDLPKFPPLKVSTSEMIQCLFCLCCIMDRNSQGKALCHNERLGIILHSIAELHLITISLTEFFEIEMLMAQSRKYYEHLAQCVECGSDTGDTTGKHDPTHISFFYDSELMRWLCLCVGKLAENFPVGSNGLIRKGMVPLIEMILKNDGSPITRSAAAYSLGCMIGLSMNSPSSSRSASQEVDSDLELVAVLLWSVKEDSSTMVRREALLGIAKFMCHPQHTAMLAVVQHLMEEEERHLKREKLEKDKKLDNNNTDQPTVSSTFRQKRFERSVSGLHTPPAAMFASHKIDEENHIPRVSSGVAVGNVQKERVSLDRVNCEKWVNSVHWDQYRSVWKIIHSLQAKGPDDDDGSKNTLLTKDPFPVISKLASSLVFHIQSQKPCLKPDDHCLDNASEKARRLLGAAPTEVHNKRSHFKKIASMTDFQNAAHFSGNKSLNRDRNEPEIELLPPKRSSKQLETREETMRFLGLQSLLYSWCSLRFSSPMLDTTDELLDPLSPQGASHFWNYRQNMKMINTAKNFSQTDLHDIQLTVSYEDIEDANLIKYFNDAEFIRGSLSPNLHHRLNKSHMNEPDLSMKCSALSKNRENISPKPELDLSHCSSKDCVVHSSFWKSSANHKVRFWKMHLNQNVLSQKKLRESYIFGLNRPSIEEDWDCLDKSAHGIHASHLRTVSPNLRLASGSRVIVSGEVGLGVTSGQNTASQLQSISTESRSRRQMEELAKRLTLGVTTEDWTVRRLQQSAVWDSKSEMTSQLLHHPFNDALVVADDSANLSLWNCQRGLELNRFSNHSTNARTTSLCWINSHDDALLTVCSGDGVIRVWRDVAAGVGEQSLVTAWSAAPEVCIVSNLFRFV
eukprot:TRINITY_DN105_c0_g2_i2.p1 TRINITY_DN105_c0_g2~~TRINITY_DN105_c0_g2_i2.p1  ORF type:complete len:1377 (-),score=237.03 TRINITY_DN105_c0_g2_i2:973-5103(-)